MNFQDRSKDSVQSLLAQLRAAQDDNASTPTTPSTSISTSRPTPTQARDQPSAGPSTQQLNDLLSSLGHNQPSPPTPKRKSLIEPFGPVAQAQAQAARIPTPDTAQPIPTNGTETDRGELSFTKSLPIVSSLLADEGFKKEIKRMKVDQDTLERRLWAKGEKVKAEHEKTTRTGKEIARITGKPISPTKEREWRAQLSDQMQDFYRHHCIPAIDGLATRHKEKLEALGVPGLGGDMADPKVRDRVRRIMDVLEASLDE